MSDYIIITKEESSTHYVENYAYQLEEAVKKKMKEGYIPVGGVAVRAGTQRGAYLMQAMIKN